MPEIRTLERISQGSVHIASVDAGSVRVAQIDQAQIIIPGDQYDGPYTVTPRVEAQTLPTTYKTMAHDVTVLEIPYYETSNLSGGYTAIIGG